MKVLSLFDGMACGMLAMLEAGIKVDRYVAYEIDKYAVQTSSHNFPMIEHKGDVFQADFTEFFGFDFLVGGSPCTYWSIAQKNNRETEASGIGWELFSQYVRALREAQPMFFIYENNKSMSKAIRESITETFGFEPICINSDLVSAQKRQRLYWVGKRNHDGTYGRVSVEQPEDRGILLRDVLDGGTAWQDKSFAYTTRCQAATIHDTFEKHRHTMVAEPVASTVLNVNPSGKGINGAVGRIDAKTRCLTTNKGEGQKIICPVGEPVNLDEIYGLTSNDTYIQYDLSGKNHCSQDQRAYYPHSKHGTLNASSTESKTGVIDPIGIGGQANPIYEVKDGKITIKGKQYPIKLDDGYYIIRKLTVSECKRLQTVPEWYEFPVSNSQAYKMLGNGWTVEVIVHLINATQAGVLCEEQMNLFGV